MKVVLPAQDVSIQTPTGELDPIWYERLQALASFATMFQQVNPNTLTNGQVFKWNAAAKQFQPG
jgi:hypothetical protein